MAKITITIEDQLNGATSVDFKGDLPDTQGDKTPTQKTAVLLSKMITAAQTMTPPPAKRN